jgi:peptide/nickel transport system permease protein
MTLRFLRRIFVLTLTLAIGGFFGCLLLRYGPGYDFDERDLDQRYSRATLEAIHKARSGQQNIAHFYVRYLAGVIHGDLGISTAFQRPVGELIAARAPTTLRLIGLGMIVGWIAALSLGIASAIRPAGLLPIFSDLLAGLLLCFPAAVLALFLFLSGGPVPLVIAGALFPGVYRYSRALLSDSLALPHVLAAAARGIPRVRILTRYVIPPAIAPLTAFLGVSLTLAFGASIPVEVICDVPGLGQLAWKAAIARDLPLLAAITLIVTGATLAANTVADLAS